MGKYGRLGKLTSVSEVLEKLRKMCKIKPRIVEKEITETIGYISAETVKAPYNFPPYNRSAVDGYAVRAEDTYGASTLNPIVLKVKGFMHTSDKPEKYFVGKGECVEVTTGTPLPRGANAVVMVEYTKRISEDTVEIYAPVAPLQNVSIIGEDVKKGEIVVRKGEVIRPWHVGLLATLNISKIRVYDSLKAAVFGVGDELVPLGSKVGPGKIVSSTLYLVESFLKEMNVNVIIKGILPDNINVIAENVRKALKEVDMVFTTGGTSIGVKDYTVKAVRKLNPELLIHGLAIKPGRPAGIAVVSGKPVFTLSGYPVAALTVLLAVYECFHYALHGSKPPPKPKVKALLTRRVHVEPGIRGYVRVRVFRKNNEFYVEPLAITGSGILSTMVKGNGLLIVPEDVEGFDEGDVVEVELTSPII